ncbi:CU044_5270 family protein [Plantactinospora sp. GCM10030261]|uniref:CU044_5270 family protein n=1 Tax=Plantactinospora sp. GCM10030261 TaxID=3273420 RepID=UPI0036089724
MNGTPNQPDQSDRAELARLLPAPMERDLPSDRRQLLQEFVMSQIQQDGNAAERPARRAPRRRLAFLVPALATGAATAVAAVVIVSGGAATTDSPPAAAGGDRQSTAAAGVQSGQQILLVAATTADQSTEASGSYWYNKVVSVGANGKADQYEIWTDRAGQHWFRGEKTDGKLTKIGGPTAFGLGGADVTVDQIKTLPTEPEALRAEIAKIIKNGDVRTSAGPLTVEEQKRAAFEGLISLVAQLPAPPKVRGAAFRAIATYPNVTSLGPVDGGQGLRITDEVIGNARLVVDPATSQVRECNFYVSAEGTLVSAGEGGSFRLTSEWTDQLPR